MRWLLVLFALLALAAPARAEGTPDGTPDAALAALLAAAREQAREAAARGGCAAPERLVRILCEGRIRIGVREDYPLFGTRAAGGTQRAGYDVDVGAAAARALGVEPLFVRVNPATRIPLLVEDRIDLVVATMGHNTQRDGQVRFIRPHYYQSETALVGRRGLVLHGGLQDLAGRTVCVTIGNGSNAQIVSLGARLMLFDEPDDLIDNLRRDSCALAAQDDSFFAWHFTDPDFAAANERKLGFARVPWGMAVAPSGAAGLARALELASQVFHRDGVFLAIARANRVGTGFLEQQSELWRRAACDDAAGATRPGCVQPALDTALAPTPFAGHVAAAERWIAATTGVQVSLAMFRTAPAWDLFRAGVVNSLVLVAGALAATLAFALLIGAALGFGGALVRAPVLALVAVMQSSPVVLTLVIAAAIAQSAFGYSTASVLGAAIVALGLTNGSYAGQAIGEAARSLGPSAQEEGGVFRRAVGRAATQLMSFLINAAKGTPIASFIGAPELLSTLTDITSFASGRGTTYTLVLVFYVLVVMAVVWLCGRLRARLERREATAA